MTLKMQKINPVRMAAMKCLAVSIVLGAVLTISMTAAGEWVMGKKSFMLLPDLSTLICDKPASMGRCADRRELKLMDS